VSLFILPAHSTSQPRHPPSFPTRRSSDLFIFIFYRWSIWPTFFRMQKHTRDRFFMYISFNCRHLHPPLLFMNYSSLTFSSELSRSEEHTSELQSRFDLVCRLLLVQTMHHV